MTDGTTAVPRFHRVGIVAKPRNASLARELQGLMTKLAARHIDVHLDAEAARPMRSRRRDRQTATYEVSTPRRCNIVQ